METWAPMVAIGKLTTAPVQAGASVGVVQVCKR